MTSQSEAKSCPAQEWDRHVVRGARALDEGRPRVARAAFERAVGVARADVERWIAAVQFLAETEVALGNLGRAVALYGESLAAMQSRGTEAQELEGVVLRQLALIRELRGPKHPELAAVIDEVLEAAAVASGPDERMAV